VGLAGEGGGGGAGGDSGCAARYAVTLISVGAPSKVGYVSTVALGAAARRRACSRSNTSLRTRDGWASSSSSWSMPMMVDVSLTEDSTGEGADADGVLGDATLDNWLAILDSWKNLSKFDSEMPGCSEVAEDEAGEAGPGQALQLSDGGGLRSPFPKV
jgi:hypothetical protein